MVAQSATARITVYTHNLFDHVAAQGDEFATVEALIIHEPIAQMKNVNEYSSQTTQPYVAF